MGHWQKPELALKLHSGPTPAQPHPLLSAKRVLGLHSRIHKLRETYKNYLHQVSGVAMGPHEIVPSTEI